MVEARPDLGLPELQANAKAALYLPLAHTESGERESGRWGHHLVSIATGLSQVLPVVTNLTKLWRPYQKSQYWGRTVVLDSPFSA